VLFSDCGFLVYENSLRATLGTCDRMRCFITRGVPGLASAKGTFYDMEYTTTYGSVGPAYPTISPRLLIADGLPTESRGRSQ
jgi:hypothetical protein